jgi:Na+/melibiose symporter-like transporter
MNAGKIIAYIVAAILIVFGVLFILAAFSTAGQVGYIIPGLIMVAIAFGLIFWVARRSALSASQTQNITLKVDLPANVSMDSLKCKSCGGTLSAQDIQMVAGAPWVTCPYCKTSYQLTEDPKW